MPAHLVFSINICTIHAPHLPLVGATKREISFRTPLRGFDALVRTARPQGLPTMLVTPSQRVCKGKEVSLWRCSTLRLHTK